MNWRKVSIMEYKAGIQLAYGVVAAVALGPALEQILELQALDGEFVVEHK